jgi:hypothetical protein
MDERTKQSSDGSKGPAYDPREDNLDVSQLAPAEMQALAERVMLLLKRELQLERERLHGR